MQVVACLLVMLFLTISVGQLFHSHKTAVKTEQSGAEEGTYVIEKCHICEFYIHKHGKAFSLSYPPVLSVPVPELINHNTHHYIGNYKFTLQGFTNKGPPARLA